MNRSARLFASVLFAISVSGPAALAEGFVDLRVGGSFTEDDDVEVRGPGLAFEVPTEFEDSVTGGLRGGYWFDPLPWLGLAGDVTYFGSDEDAPGGVEIDVIPISPLLMLRAPLVTDEEFPNGRLQPFAGIGPGIFVSLVDFGSGEDDENVDVGLDLHAGLKFLVTPNVGIFAQYRYTWFESEADLDTAPIEIEAELSTHHVAAGVGFHF